MKKKPFYASEDEIPEEDKHLYVKKNGRWELDVDLFEDLESIIVPGLASNRDALKAEKKAAQDSLKEVQKQLKDVEAELSKVKKPGMVILTKEDADLFESYKKLGPPADIEKDLQKSKEIEEKLQKIEAEKRLDDLAKDLNLNSEALKDFVETRGAGISLSSKIVKTKNEKGKEIEEKKLIVSYDEEENGKTRTREVEFLDFAKEKKIPAYLVTALFTPAEEKEERRDDTRWQKRFHIPSNSTNSTSKKSGRSTSDISKRFNERRSTRKLPWIKEKQEN